MAWIRTIKEDEAGPELATVYQRVKGSRGKLSNILSVHSLLPKTLQTHMDLYMAVMFDASGLSREEREMIAVVVSAANQCPYCIQHHTEALRHYWKNEERLAAFAADYQGIDLSPRMRAVLDYAAQLTREPNGVAEKDIASLREQGLSDENILSVNLVTSYFNFVNRIALGLGVEFAPDEIRGYRV